jgi:hypothetical protein
VELSRPNAEPAPEAPDAWSAPRGRDLLAGVAVLAVLVAILVVFRSDVPPAPRNGGPEPLSRGAAAPATPLPMPWSEVPVVRSVSDLPRELVVPVAEGLAQARSRLERCVALEHRRARAAPPPARHAAPAEVVLRLAARAGAVQVDGLEVTAPGNAPEVVACARRLLDGDTLAAGAGVPGWRQRLALSLE